MEEDRDLKIITARKMAELRRRMSQQTPPPPKAEKSDKEVVLEMLYDRGDEVLEAAFARYPKETGQVVGYLAKMIKEGKVAERISGGELLGAMRGLGMRVSLQTTIRVEDHGKFVSLAEKLRKSEEENQ